MRAFVFALLMLNTSCAGLGTHAMRGDPLRCASIETAFIGWGAVAAFASTISAGGAIASIPSDDERARLYIAVGELGFTALAASALYLRDALSRDWGAECEVQIPNAANIAAGVARTSTAAPHR